VFGQYSESKPCGWCLDIILGFQTPLLEFAHYDVLETRLWIFETPLLYSLQVAAELGLENGVYNFPKQRTVFRSTDYRRLKSRMGMNAWKL
jgi:hypothetical protein